MKKGSEVKVNFLETYTYSFKCPHCHYSTVKVSRLTLNVLKCEKCGKLVCRWAGEEIWYTSNGIIDALQSPELIE